MPRGQGFSGSAARLTHTTLPGHASLAPLAPSCSIRPSPPFSPAVTLTLRVCLPFPLAPKRCFDWARALSYLTSYECV